MVTLIVDSPFLADGAFIVDTPFVEEAPPVAGQVTVGSSVSTGPGSLAYNHTGDPPSAGMIATYDTHTVGGGTVTVNADLTFTIDGGTADDTFNWSLDDGIAVSHALVTLALPLEEPEEPDPVPEDPKGPIKQPSPLVKPLVRTYVQPLVR